MIDIIFKCGLAWACSIRIVVHESDISENAAYMQVSSTSSQWRKYLFHDLGTCIAMHAATAISSLAWY